MRLAVGSDESTHLTDFVIAYLREKGHDLDLFGPVTGKNLPWPAVSQQVAEQVASGKADQAVLFCWTGTGASIAANKVPGVRAALCHDAQTARGARWWNDANVLVLSLRATSEPIAGEILDAWFAEQVQAEEMESINQIRKMEEEYRLTQDWERRLSMQYRRFGRTGWMVSDIGYGMWGMGGDWKGSDDEEALSSLQQALDRGCNFFDTAWAYGDGHSEVLLGQLVRANPDKEIFTATKIPPKNLQWPSRREFSLDDCFPPDHIEEYVHKSLKNAGFESFDLIQFHTWEDSWVEDDRWAKEMDELRSQGLIRAVGISLNRWEPWNGVKTVRSGLVDSVQVIYNIFDQNPEDELFPACQEMDVAVIARVPFDEGTLTGTLTKNSKWPEGDWRNTYFVPENLIPAVERADAIKEILPEGMTLPEAALRFILGNQTVSTIIPGMRKLNHVEANIACSDKGTLAPDLQARLAAFRWDREPTDWSQ